jgi:hypothetical protein
VPGECVNQNSSNVLSRLFQLPAQGLYGLITSSFKTGSLSLGKQVSPRDVQLDFRDFVSLFPILLNAEKHFTGNQVIVKCGQLLETALNEIEQTLIGVKMNGVNLYLHGTAF